YLFVKTDPAASSTARLTKFSEAISSSPRFCRSISFRITSARSGSVSESVRRLRSRLVLVDMSWLSSPRLGAKRVGFRLSNLVDPALMTPPGEGSLQPQVEDLVGERGGHNASSHGEHVRVVVLTRQTGSEQVVAQRSAHTGDLVGGNLFTLPA